MNDWRLTKRQNEAMQLFAKGLSNKQAAEAMNIKMSTLKTFLDCIYTTYGVNNKLNAVLMWQKNVKEV